MDTFWSISYVVLTIYTWGSGEKTLPANVVSFLVCVWGIRLASHISLRNLGKKEDYRYENMRKKWNYVWTNAYIKVFMLQGFLMFLISFPIVLINRTSAIRFNWGLFIGVAIWGIGFLFEVIGDRQLKAFLNRKNRKKRFMDEGLWAYTRHPNYFGEVTMWWGIFVIVVASTKYYITIVSPIVITYLILYVSGIPLLEKKYEGVEAFEAYKRKTNKFFPWFIKQ